MSDEFGLPEPTKPLKMPKVRAPRGTGSIKVEPMSLEQFRSYLKGIMFVGGPTWRPDREQWESIVAIIDKLTPDTPPQQRPQQYSAAPQAAAAGWDQTQPQWQPMQAQPIPRSSIDPVTGAEDGPYNSPFI